MKIESFLDRIYSFSPSDFLLHLPDALPDGVSLTQALCQNPYSDSPTAVQALKVDSHHGYHVSPRYRCFVIWSLPFLVCKSISYRSYPLLCLYVMSDKISLLNYLDTFSLKQFYTHSEYILLCVYITVMQSSAFWTNPLPDCQVFYICIFISTAYAGL